MFNLVANLSATTREEILNDEHYLVAPVTLIVEGILNGSRGPRYYPLEEISKNIHLWNGVPLVINHPYIDNKPTSARSPSIQEKYGVGSVFNVVMEGQKLRGEAWFNISSLQRISNGILQRLRKGEAIEVSTGLLAESILAEADSTFNGTAYTAIARNYQPDHLAILPDEKGACSVDAGCGVLNKKQISTNQTQGDRQMPKTPKERKVMIDGFIANSCCWKEEHRVALNELGDDLLDMMDAREKTDTKNTLVANAAMKEFKDENGNVHTFNTDTQGWDTVLNKEEKKEPDTKPASTEGKEETVENKETKPLTQKEWLAQAPKEISEAVINASKITAKAKAEEVLKLTVNVADDKKEAVIALLNTKSLEELETLVSLLPEAKTGERLFNSADFTGKAGGGELQIQNEETKGTPLVVPDMFADEDKK